jgi:hypothetical protein
MDLSQSKLQYYSKQLKRNKPVEVIEIATITNGLKGHCYMVNPSREVENRGILEGKLCTHSILCISSLANYHNFQYY